MNSFKHGFLARTPLVLLAAALLLVPAFLVLQAVFTSGLWSSVPLKYWVRDRLDDDTFVSWSVGRSKQDQAAPAIYVLGGSTAREAIVSGPSLAADVHRLGGPRVAAYDMGSIHQNFAHSLAVADNVPGKDAWIVIGVSIGRFAGEEAPNLDQAVGRGLLLKSDFLKQYVADDYGRYKYDPTILPGIFQYLTDLARSYASSAYRGEVSTERYELHRVSAETQLSTKRKQREVELWYKLRYPAFKRYFSLNVKMLDQLLRRCEERGLHAVIVELPLNRDIAGTRLDRLVAQYQVPVKRLASRYDVPYVDFNEELAIPDAYFADLQHLLQPGRVIWQRRLAQTIVTLMHREATAGASG